jgi:hypothetical protein
MELAQRKPITMREFFGHRTLLELPGLEAVPEAVSKVS